MNTSALPRTAFPAGAPASESPLNAGLPRALDEAFSETSLCRLLGPQAAEICAAHWEQTLQAPLRDFLSRPGKCFRGRLAGLAYQSAGGAGALPEVAAQMVEALHAGSLIVDDIEDEAEERRGAPALHRSYGLQRALNAGNWLYFWPGVLAERLEVPPDTLLAIYQRMHLTMLRCHHGQALDLALRVSELRQEQIPGVVACMTRLKTGCLLEFSAELGALLAGAPPESVAAHGRFGGELGVALQMLDDWSGVVSRKRREKAREDFVHARPTWAWAWVAQECKEADFAALQTQARHVAAGDASWEALRHALARRVGSACPPRIRELLGAAQLRLQPHVRNASALDALREEIARLENSYA